MENAIQILKQTSDGLVFDTKELFNILDKIDENNISIVSITGKQNSGKSLLINHLMRYLKRNEPNKNYSQLEKRSDCHNQTQACGIWMCSKPFVVTANDGSEMVLLLMETVCNFNDERCSECGIIFAISLLLSSTLILNIQNNVTEDIMKFVEHFTLFAQSMIDESKPELFQRLLFLVRDLDNECAYRFGYHDDYRPDNNNYMKNFIKSNTNHCFEGQSSREKLLSCFDGISCYLMPRPGKYVTKSIRLIDREFREKLQEFVALIIRDLAVKTIGGQKLTVNSLNHYINKWQKILITDIKFEVEFRSPVSDVNELEIVFQFACDEYETNLLSCIKSNPTDDQLLTRHNNAEEECWHRIGLKLGWDWECDWDIDVSDECFNNMVDSLRETISNRFQYYRSKNSERIDNEVKQLKCVPCIARSVRPIETISQKSNNIIALELPCPGYYNGSCDREDQYWFCSICNVQLKYGIDGYLYCECGRAGVYSFEFKCNSKNHRSNYVKFIDNQLNQLLNNKNIDVLTLCETGVVKSKMSENSTQFKDNSLSISDVLSNGYSRNSFDRFGDDLCEHILQYLSFKDKMCFECVNKQWKRSVFSRQHRLVITYHTSKCLDSLPSSKLLCYAAHHHVCHHLIKKYENGLEMNLRNYVSYVETVLRKCTNIENIYIDNQCCYSDCISPALLLRIIADNCQNLRSIEFKYLSEAISDNSWKYFGQMFGQTLQSITFTRNQSCSTLLNYCPNILRISGIDLKDLFGNNSVLLPKLVEVRHAVGYQNTAIMDLFVAKYSNIKVFHCRLDKNNCYTFMSQISQLNKLEKLMLDIIPNINDFIEFIDGIKKLSGKKQLKYMHLRFYECKISTQLYIPVQLLTSINCISSLKYLKIQLRVIGENPDLSVKLLENCKQLTHLYIDGISSNMFCTDIQLYLPQIKRFVLRSRD